MWKCRRCLEGSFSVLWVFCAWDGEARGWLVVCVSVYGGGGGQVELPPFLGLFRFLQVQHSSSWRSHLN